jgi:hypothetical protein
VFSGVRDSWKHPCSGFATRSDVLDSAVWETVGDREEVQGGESSVEWDYRANVGIHLLGVQEASDVTGAKSLLLRAIEYSLGSREKERVHVVPEGSVFFMFVCGVHIDRLLEGSHHNHTDPIRKVRSEHVHQFLLGQC